MRHNSVDALLDIIADPETTHADGVAALEELRQLALGGDEVAVDAADVYLRLVVGPPASDGPRIADGGG